MQARRTKCEHQNRDPIVWTSHRVMKWIREIDLKVGEVVSQRCNYLLSEGYADTTGAPHS